MTTRISPTADLTEREWEALSAFLDEQLSPKERMILENRLGDEPNLRSALEDLRRTRSLVRDQPKMRAPRNFTLTPEMAGLRPGSRPHPGAYPMLRLASVLAAIFFAIISVGDLATRKAQPVAQVMMASEVEAEMPPVATVGMGGMGGGSAQTDAPAPPSATEALAPPMEAPVFAAPTQPVKESMEKVAEEATQLTTDANTILVTPLGLPATPTSPVVLEVADQVVSVPDLAPAPTQVQEGKVTLPRSEREMTVAVWGWSFLKAMQVLLALLAVSTGLAAFYLRRPGRK